MRKKKLFHHFRGALSCLVSDDFLVCTEIKDPKIFPFNVIRYRLLTWSYMGKNSHNRFTAKRE